MKKSILTLCILISLAAAGQKKDSVAYDTAFVFTMKEIEHLKGILLESKVIVNGEQLSGKQLYSLFAWIDQRGRLLEKTKTPITK